MASYSAYEGNCFAILLLSQMSVFPYQLVDTDPVKMAVEFCAKQLEGDFPRAVQDDDKTTVKEVAGGWKSSGGFFEVSIPFKTSDRSGVQIMTVLVQGESGRPVRVIYNSSFGCQIFWSDGTVTGKGWGS